MTQSKISQMTHWFSDEEGPWGSKKKATPKTERKRPSSNSDNNSQQEQPDLDDIIRQAQDRVKNIMGNRGKHGGRRTSGGNGGNSGDADTRLFGILGVIGVLLWLASGFYIVAPDEQGVVLRFGKYVQTTQAGPNYHLPWPMETVMKPKVTRENIVEIGFRGSRQVNSFLTRRGSQQRLNNDQIMDIAQESLMLTGDENIVDLDFTVRWKISDAKQYLFNVTNPDETIKHVAESAMREIVGQHPIDDVLTNNKFAVEQETKLLIQKVVDTYSMGIMINGVELQKVDPPKEVIGSFQDVQAAKADAKTLQNKAQGYANDILPRARGEVAQIMQEAEAYKASKIAKAEGDAQRFNSQLREYRKAREITMKRMYIETMEEVLSKSRKIIVGKEVAKSVMPFLPLANQSTAKGGKK